MSNKQELVDILKSKFKLIVEGSEKAEDVKATDDGNTLSLYNVGVMDVNSKGELVGRRIRFYVINEGHPQEIMTTDEAGVSTGTGEFTTKVEEASWLNGETPLTLLELEAAQALIPTREQKLKATLAGLQQLGEVEGEDLSALGVPFAKLSIGGVSYFVAELDGELQQLKAKSVTN